MIRLQCQGCQAALEFEVAAAGATGPCWRCAAPVTVPVPPMLAIACGQCGTASEYASHLIGQSGPCRQCGATVTVDLRVARLPGASPSPAATPAGPPAAPAGPLQVQANKAQRSTLAAVEKEARKVGQQVLGSKVVQVAQGVSGGENIGEALKARFSPFGGKFRTDRVQAFKVATRHGEYYLVIPWSGNVMLPHEYCSVLRGNLPSSLYLTRGLLGSWSTGRWSGSAGGEEDPTALAADKVYKLNDGIEWDWEQGRLRIKLGWGMQVVPQGPGQVMHHVKTAKRGILIRDFGMGWYVERQMAFSQFAAQFPPSNAAPQYSMAPFALLFEDDILAAPTG